MFLAQAKWGNFEFMALAAQQDTARKLLASALLEHGREIGVCVGATPVRLQRLDVNGVVRNGLPMVLSDKTQLVANVTAGMTAKQVVGTMLAEMDPDTWKAGVKVYSRGSKTRFGRCTGQQSRCRLDGCTGMRISVRWPGGKHTQLCSDGLKRFKDGWQLV